MRKTNTKTLDLIIVIVLILICAAAIFAIVKPKKQTAAVSSPEALDWRSYNGKTLGIITGSSFEAPTLENFPDSEYLYYNSYSDINTALTSGMIEGYVGDEPALRAINTEQPQIDFIKEVI